MSSNEQKRKEIWSFELTIKSFFLRSLEDKEPVPLVCCCHMCKCLVCITCTMSCNGVVLSYGGVLATSRGHLWALFCFFTAHNVQHLQVAIYPVDDDLKQSFNEPREYDFMVSTKKYIFFVLTIKFICLHSLEETALLLIVTYRMWCHLQSYVF